jgi:hypothetical protein
MVSRPVVVFAEVARMGLWKSLCKTLECPVRPQKSILFNGLCRLDIFCPVENLGISHAISRLFRAICGNSVSECRFGGHFINSTPTDKLALLVFQVSCVIS